MDAKELRIGNLVYSKHCDGILIIDEITRSFYNEYVICIVDHDNFIEIDAIKPIELTEDIFIQAGFNYEKSDNSFWHDELHISFHKNNGESNWGLRNYGISDNIDNKFYPMIEEYPISDKPIEYVHQLQNLYFALTVKELDINLTTNNND